MTKQGNFIINGHDKVVVFHVYRNIKTPQIIELKFLNSELVINSLDIFKTFDVSLEILEKLFSKEEINIEDYPKANPLEVGKTLPRFLFMKRNSYFDFGKLGRKKYNQKTNILRQIEGQELADNLYDSTQKLILKKNSVLTGKNFQLLQNALQKKKIPAINIPHSTNDLYVIKIKAPQNPARTLFVVGIAEDLSEEKTYFDLADLVCTISNYINLHHGLGEKAKEEEKDNLENQVVRRVGDLVYSVFENKLGGYLQSLGSKYVTNYLSQLKKVDLSKIPDLKEFNNLLKIYFFNSSPLVQLQNQNNPLSEISYARKLSVLGLGGFSSSNTTLAARNINPSYYGRYDLVETPEGQRVGLIHNLAIGTKINDYGQVIIPCYLVKNGVVVSQLDYLNSEEEWDKHIAHCNIKIDEKNRILEEEVPVRHRGEFKLVTKEKVDYIDSSFYQLNSVTSATIPFFQHNDATRMLMSSNMQRQAVTLLKSEAPLVASGLESALSNNSSLTVETEEAGKVEYVDNQQIIIKENDKGERTYKLSQSVVSNKNILNFSLPLVKQGEKVKKGQIIACGSYTNQGELSLGYNLRVAYLCWNGYNYEDAIVVSDRLIKEDILTSLFVKKYKIIRYNTKHGPEVFTPAPNLPAPLPHLDKNGLVKIGSEVKGGDILVGKITPEPFLNKESEEEMLLLNLLGQKTQKFFNSSLRLPAGEKGTVYAVETKKIMKKKDELELVEVYVFCERKLEVGDKLTTRFGNKGVVAKIVPEVDMPFDEEGKTIDIIFNPLGIPTRMNLGQLLETMLASAAHQLGEKLLVRPFNTLNLEIIQEIMKEAKIKN
ncbi:10711_t:CDS:2 [Funneliformis geosporum]|uniref:DNA-directed RNA polymerase n=1 Tax=Funneliformis geosporum TaxID=1117311 RepID=A0A9W4WHM9_9GLOM|nr:10711_t:CDS:2 [Funneliformis geosporum]